MADDVARQFIAALGRLESQSDLDTIVSLFAEGAQVGNALMPEHFHGRDGAREFWQRYRDTFSTVRSTFRNVIVSEDHAALVARPEFQPTAESQAVVHDLALASQIEAVLLHDPNVWVENLRVSVRQGEVTLAGQVLAEEDRELAEASARRVGDVHLVRNEIAVQPPPLAGM